LKKFDKLVFQSFIGPYLLSFFVAEFVLVMQFLWKYIDEILGKGFGVFELLELIGYFMVTQIPMALPIAVLISSVMVFGNMSEQHELSSMKSAGVSLVRILRPGIVLALVTASLSLLSSNYLKPKANFKFQKRFRSIQAQKPNLTIEEKIFNRDFKGFAIRVNEKSDDGEGISDISIYDHTKTDKSLLNFIKAKEGRMYNSEDGRFFIMELVDGNQYSEMKRNRSKKENKKKYPFLRTEFEQWTKSFDLGQFDSDEDGVMISRNKEDMLNTFQLLTAIDSVNQFKANLRDQLINGKPAVKKQNILKENKRKGPKKNNKATSTAKKKFTSKDIEKIAKVAKEKSKNKAPITFMKINKDTTVTSFVQYLSKKDRATYVTRALQAANRKMDSVRSTNAQIISATKKREKYLLRLNQMYAFASICIVFMFIGGPLGSIIRKGGYGYPLLIAILFYMLFIIMTIMGEKLVRSQRMDPIVAAWFSNMLVAPVAILLTYMALKDLTLKSINLSSLFRKKK